MRSGVIAQKVGMMRVFTDAGEHVPATVLRLANCQVIAHRTKDKNGYVALQLGAGSRKVGNVNKAERGLVLVEGAVPGAKGGWITLRDAVKKTLPKDIPTPGKFRLPGAAAAAAAPSGRWCAAMPSGCPRRCAPSRSSTRCRPRPRTAASSFSRTLR